MAGCRPQRRARSAGRADTRLPAAVVVVGMAMPVTVVPMSMSVAAEVNVIGTARKLGNSAATVRDPPPMIPPTRPMILSTPGGDAFAKIKPQPDGKDQHDGGMGDGGHDSEQQQGADECAYPSKRIGGDRRLAVAGSGSNSLQSGSQQQSQRQTGPTL